LCTLGLVLFFVAVLLFSGHSKSASFEQKLQAAEARNAELAKDVDAIKKQLRELNSGTAAPK
jgi:cell division protein FtsB